MGGGKESQSTCSVVMFDFVSSGFHRCSVQMWMFQVHLLSFILRMVGTFCEPHDLYLQSTVIDIGQNTVIYHFH